MNETSLEEIRNLQERVATRLKPLLYSDLPIFIKANAAMALAKTHVRSAEKAVLEFFDNYPELEETIQALGDLGTEDSLGRLINQVRDKRSKNRDVIAEALGNFHFPEAAECLKELLGDEDRHVRFQAASSLFTYGGRDAALALCRYISDRDEWISMTILRYLCRMKEHESIPFLAEQFAKDNDLRRKAQMVSFLSMFRSVTLVNIFDEGLRGKDARLKANSIEAIGELDLPPHEIENRILAFLHDPNNRIRANAILALARVQPERIHPEIVQMVESSDIQLRRSAAYILGQIQPEGNEELAAKLMVDPSDDVRRRMILSLKNFPPDFVKSQIERVITDSNKWIRKFAIETAANIPNFPKHPVLKQFKLETAYPNLVACIEFFAKQPDEEGIRVMRQRVKDPRHQVVSALIRAIGKIYGLQGLQTLASQINSRDPKIFTTYVVEYFSLGGIDLFNSIIEKASLIKKPPTNEIFLTALKGCLDVLSKSAVPTPLLQAISSVHMHEELAKESPKPQPKPSKPIEQPPIAVVEPPPELPPQEIPQPPVFSPPLEENEGVKKKKKKSIPTSFTSGVKYYNLGKYKKARNLFLEALTESPDLVKAHYYLGMMAFEERDFETARESLTLYLESDPENRKALQALARIYKHQRNWLQVARIYEKLTADLKSPLDKTSMRMFRELGAAYIFLKRYQEAESVLETLFNSDSTDLETNFHLAMVYFHLQKYSQSEALLSDIIAGTETDDKLHIMAESLFEKLHQQIGQTNPESLKAPDTELTEPGKTPPIKLSNDDDKQEGSNFLDELPLPTFGTTPEDKTDMPAFDPTAFGASNLELPSIDDLNPAKKSDSDNSK